MVGPGKLLLILKFNIESLLKQLSYHGNSYDKPNDYNYFYYSKSNAVKKLMQY